MKRPPSHTPTRPLTHEPPLLMALVLRVVSGADFGSTLRLERGSYVVGKSPESDLVLTDDAISRAHLLVQVQAGFVRLTDNHSTNGAFFQGRRFESLDAGPGTEVHVGKTVLRLEALDAQAPELAPSEQTSFGALVGKSLRMRTVFALLEKLAIGDADVLLQGETGTGKELAARALHAAGKRRERPFVVLDVGALPRTLVEAELFGHARGAFTGALTDRVGAFERAQGGTVFLDEAGEIPLEVQSRLLGVLERRVVQPLGADRPRPVDVRLISATHRNLEQDVAAGRFRRDLYHRLAVATVTLPPLRDRAEDIPMLIETIATARGWDATQMSAQTRSLLAGYGWPGNVRELANLVARVLQLGVAPFSETPEASSEELPFKDAKERLLLAFEREYLERLLARCEDNLSRAARAAGVERVHLRKLLRKHGLRAGSERGGGSRG